MKIIRIPLKSLHNEGRFGFFAGLKVLVGKSGPAALLILALFNLLKPQANTNITQRCI